MSEAPERIWVQWPHRNSTGLAFTCQARPPAFRHEYTLSTEAQRIVDAAREAPQWDTVNDKLAPDVSAARALVPADALAEVEKLRADRDEYREAFTRDNADLAVALLSLTAAEAEVARLRAERDEWNRLYWLIRSFAVHDDDCTINRHPHYRDCSCGLRAALTTPKKDTP